MKFVIKIEDQENGRVSVNSDPDMKTLAAMARGKDLTPAGAYALGALAKIIKDSQDQAAEKMKEKFNAGLIPAFPSKRNMFA